MTERDIWQSKAKDLGWEWSPAHGGYIHESHRRHRSLGWDDYEVAECAEDACFASGVETLTEAAAA